MSTTELLHLAGSSWVIPGPTNIGVVERDGGVYLIDSGNDKDAGRKINRLINDKGWKLSGIINTHSNADHIGANDYFRRMTNCRIFATQTEKAFIESPQLEGAFLWGGYTPNEMKNKFFEAKPSRVTDLSRVDSLGDRDSVDGANGVGAEILPGLRAIALPGHYFEMIGVVTDDRVAYLGDAMFGVTVLEKHPIPYVYDVARYKETIERIKSLDADYFVISHGEIERNIQSLAALNLQRAADIEGYIMESLAGLEHHGDGPAPSGQSFEDILSYVCDKMGVALDVGQYALTGNTIRSFLSYLLNSGTIAYQFADNRMYWTIK